MTSAELLLTLRREVAALQAFGELCRSPDALRWLGWRVPLDGPIGRLLDAISEVEGEVAGREGVTRADEGAANINRKAA